MYGNRQIFRLLVEMNGKLDKILATVQVDLSKEDQSLNQETGKVQDALHRVPQPQPKTGGK